ncbi:MAG: alpha/beta fold hydrolase [Bacteroidota bacterium]|nr:alpha/beta fold hydrolase [Bacteroidota bacterium]
METIVLIHGAWSDATAWVLVAPILKAKGYEVIAINLPGHGEDKTSFADISMKSYLAATKDAIGARKNIILVGHSMAGQILSQIGEDIPHQIKKLVYLAACLPKDGESLIDLAKADVDGHTAKYLEVDAEKHAAIIKKDGVVELFFQDTPKDILEGILANWKTEPLAPLSAPVSLTDANYGSVKKAYIQTVNDYAISLVLQQKMIKAAPNIEQTFVLNSSHTPYFSMPEQLAEYILEAAK